jgi:uncharacterized protein
MKENVYELTHITLNYTGQAQLRKGRLSDISFLESWIRAYIAEAKLDKVDPAYLLKKLIEEDRLYLWEMGGKILSMAACSGKTFNGIRINLVFTPKELRNKGHASSCVAALADHLLKNGYRKCFLFADQDNPIANSIDTKMGFQLVGEYKECDLML